MKKEVYAKSLYEDNATDYSDLLEAVGEAFRESIRQIMNRIGFTNGMKVLDVGAGIGHDLIDIAAAVAPDGMVTGLEIAEPHFIKAKRNAELSGHSAKIRMLHCDLFSLDQSKLYDIIWCNTTIACFLDPLEGLVKMNSLLKEGGKVVVINDLCPMHWLPGTLLGQDRARESRLYSAIFENLKQHRRMRRKECGVAIQHDASCAGLMQLADFHRLESRTAVAEEAGQLSEPLMKVMQLFLQRSFSDRTKKYLSEEDRKFVNKISDPDSAFYLLKRRDLHIIKPITALIGYR
ncbi:MAG: class I SAM-dependent methyltransferase [Candidatus Electrothrix sp. AW3_4]|nr:class I SAM-dependent methyltransferase [Candidatus Electrothrix gigas]